MYKKILVPLDGSELASSVLPHLREIVSCTHAQVILLRATPEPIFPSVGTGPREPQRIDTPPRTLDGMAWRLKPDPVHRTEWIEHEVESAQRYLTEVAADLAKSGIQARILVQPGATAGAILDAADHEGVDLITMATHGRSGIGRFLLGSVADRVVHYAKVPVLLVRPDEPEGTSAKDTGFVNKRILVPLDGSPLANALLPHVRELAQCTGAKVLLLRVIPSPTVWPDEAESFAFSGGLVSVGSYAIKESTLWTHEQDKQPEPPDTRRALQAEHIREAAQNSLDVAATELRHADLQVETMIQEGKPAETILDVAQSCHADAIAMSTHGRSGLQRFLLGSVARRVLEYAKLPVLLVRVKE